MYVHGAKQEAKDTCRRSRDRRLIAEIILSAHSISGARRVGVENIDLFLPSHKFHCTMQQIISWFHDMW